MSDNWRCACEVHGDGDSACEIIRLRSALAAAERQRDEAKARARRALAERAIALNVKSKEGLLSSEWLLRTGLAEKRAVAAEAERDRLREALRQLEDDGDDYAAAVAHAALAGAPAKEEP